MLGQMGATFSIAEVSMRMEGAFFSVARTTPLVADLHRQQAQINWVSDGHRDGQGSTHTSKLITAWYM